MKHFALLASLLFLTVYSVVQESVNNFTVKDNEIIWQKVYDTPLSFQALTDVIKSSGLISNIQVAENKISGELKPIDADFKAAGYSEMLTPMYVSRSHIAGFMNIDYKEGKYRVTLNKIELTQKYSDGLSQLGEKSTLDSYGLKNSKTEFTNGFKKSPSIILNYSSDKKFHLKAEQKSDW